MPNYVGSGPGGSIQPGVDPWTPVQGEWVRQDLQDHEDGLADHETRIDTLESGSGGDVDGPASSVDETLARFNGTTGKIIQGSGIIVTDAAVGSINGDNTGDVTLVNTAANFLTLAAQVLTTALINLATHVTGRLLYANLTAAGSANRLLGRGSGSPGDWQEIALGAGLSMSGTTLSSTGGGGASALDDLTDVVITAPATDHILKYNGSEFVNSATLPNHSATLLTSGIIPDARMPDLTGDVTTVEGAVATTIANDAVTYAKMQNVSAASRLLGRGSAGGAGDPEQITLGANLVMTGTTLSATGGGTGDVVGPASSVDLEIALFDSTTGKLLERATGTGFVHATAGVYSAAKLKRVVGAIIGDGTSIITTGVSGYVSCPVAGTITKVRLLSSDASVTSGSIVIDIWKDTYANYPPAVGDTITAAAKPTISSAIKSEDATLTGWTTAVAAGDVFGFNVDSVTSFTRVTVELTVEES